jgi:hypothetical protein
LHTTFKKYSLTVAEIVMRGTQAMLWQMSISVE